MAEKSKEHKCVAVVRIRGTISALREARETLQMLHLMRNNHAVLIDDRESFRGMLKAVQSFVTWGEASKETVDLMIRKKGRLAGSKKLTDEYVQKNGYRSLEELVEAVSSGCAEYWSLPNIQPVFRLHPPSKGFRGKIKQSYGARGELGYRGEKINELIKRMV